MRRERALKIVLVVVGLLFTAGVVPLTMFFSREPAVPMIMSIYVTLGIFLLLAVRDPAANRSLIAFGGWANLAHAGVMAAQEYRAVRRLASRLRHPDPRRTKVRQGLPYTHKRLSSVEWLHHRANLQQPIRVGEERAHGRGLRTEDSREEISAFRTEGRARSHAAAIPDSSEGCPPDRGRG
jgi:hypothetical protein